MIAQKYHLDIQINDLMIKCTLGCGAFGRVKLVKHKDSGELYALKILVKNDIVANNLQDHVINERNVMMVLDHPFILHLHNTYRDDRCLYFLLELCLGGELFTFLRKAGRFNEKTSKFFAATVVMAFQDMVRAGDRCVCVRARVCVGVCVCGIRSCLAQILGQR